MRERWRECRSSERSEEDAVDSTHLLSVCTAHCCLQTSGLTLITHICRQGAGEGERRASIFEAQIKKKNYTSPLIHPLHSPSCIPPSAFLCFLSSPLLQPRLTFYPPFDFVLILDIAHILTAKKTTEKQVSRRRREQKDTVSAGTCSDFILALKR